jgi:hypothetical protein
MEFSCTIVFQAASASVLFHNVQVRLFTYGIHIIIFEFDVFAILLCIETDKYKAKFERGRF